MPELPEVETIKRTLEKKIVGRKIVDIKINASSLIKIPSVELFEALLKNSKILSIKRRGKYLLFCLEEDKFLISHLRMTGQYTYVSASKPLKKHTHIIFILDNGYELRYTDIRRFGTIYLLDKSEFNLVKGLYELGPEPLSDDFTIDYLKEKIKNKRKKVKQLLLDQKIIAGIGNIYADEILFDAGVHPEREVNSLSDLEIEKIFNSIVRLLKLGINNRGTTFRDYIDGDGRKGSFQELLKVYGKSGTACPKCGSLLVKLKVGGRSSVYCINCQK